MKLKYDLNPYAWHTMESNWYKLFCKAVAPTLSNNPIYEDMNKHNLVQIWTSISKKWRRKVFRFNSPQELKKKLYVSNKATDMLFTYIYILKMYV